MDKQSRYIVIGLLLVMITAAVFLRTLSHDFVFDDKQYIEENPYIQNGLTWQSVRWALTSFYAYNWHPLTWLSHMLDVEFYGLKPMGHHLTNLLIHLVNVLLLFLVLSRMTGSVWRSGFVAALFGIHPLHVESVAWVSERKDVLSTLFWILTMWAYVRYAERPSVKRYLPVVGLFALGLTAKSMLVTLPFVLLLLDYWPLGRFPGFRVQSSRFKVGVPATNTQHPTPNTQSQSRSPRLMVLEKVPLLVLAAGSCVVTYLAQHEGRAVAPSEVFALGARLENALVAYAAYIGRMFVPARLGVYYPHPGSGLPAWQIVLSGLALVLITTLALVPARRRRYMAVGWLWYLGTLVPVIGLVQVGSQAMADRYTYVPLIGLFIALAWAIPDLFESWNKRPQIALSVVAAVIILVLATCAWRQAGYWRDNMTLLARTLQVTKNNYFIENNLGVVLEERGKVKEAVAHYTRAIRINPRYADPRVNLANILSNQGKVDEAITGYKRAIRLNPYEARAYNNLGAVLEQRGEVEAAIEYYSKAAEVQPDLAAAHANLGHAYLEVGRTDEAIEEYVEAARLDPLSAETHHSLGLALAQAGSMEEAIRCHEEALRINPDYADAHVDLGVALVSQGRLDEAAEHYKQALRIKPAHAKAHNNLAVVWYARGDYEEAWREITLCRKYGVEPHPGLVKVVSEGLAKR